ncbi:MAG: HEAT repeat domain-containing protein [Candidatus Brocadiae bacterium]|nr:HEAT repeat domain-containing protein [Candidatus Brocadiia bacterium]
MNNKNLFLCFFCLLLCFLGRAFPENISKLGQDILSKCHLIVQGKPLKSILLPQGGKLIPMKVNSIYYGKAKISQTIHIVYLEVPSFSEQEEWIVFLKALPSGQMYECVGDFSLKEKEGAAKLLALEKIIQIESIPEENQKKKHYLESCLDGLKAQDAWTRVHWLKEWKHLVSHKPDVLDQSLLPKLQEIYDSIVDHDIRDEIRKYLIKLKKQNPQEEKETTQSLLWEKIKQAEKKLKTGSSLEEKIQALQILGFFPCSFSQKALLLSLEDPSPSIQALAAFYLGNQESSKAIPALMKILQSESHIHVKKNAIRSLGKLRAKEAIPLIQEYLSIPHTKEIAQRVLKALSSQNYAGENP